MAHAHKSFGRALGLLGLLALLGALPSCKSDDTEGGGGGDPAGGATQKVGPAGGTLTFEEQGVVLELPEGSVAEEVELSVTAVEGVEVGERVALSPVFEFGPSMSFAEGITVTLPFEGGEAPVLYWTRAGDDSTWDQPLPGIVEGGTLRTRVTHFSRGFVGESEGAPCESPEDCPRGAAYCLPNTGSGLAVTMGCVHGRCMHATISHCSKEGLVCHQGFCEYTCSEQQGCPEPTCVAPDLAASYECVLEEGRCEETATSCDDTCEDGRCLRPCETAADCPERVCSADKRAVVVNGCSDEGFCEEQSRQDCEGLGGSVAATCVEGVCQDACSPSAPCDNGCSEDGAVVLVRTCVEGVCQRTGELPCAAEQSCELGLCRAPCDVDADCPQQDDCFGEMVLRWACEADSEGGKWCTPKPIDCPEGQICAGAGECVDGSCTTKEDCPRHRGCLFDASAVLGWDCYHDTGSGRCGYGAEVERCTPPETCVEGECKEPTTAPPVGASQEHLPEGSEARWEDDTPPETAEGGPWQVEQVDLNVYDDNPPAACQGAAAPCGGAGSMFELAVTARWVAADPNSADIYAIVTVHAEGQGGGPGYLIIKNPPLLVEGPPTYVIGLPLRVGAETPRGTYELGVAMATGSEGQVDRGTVGQYMGSLIQVEAREAGN